MAREQPFDAVMLATGYRAALGLLGPLVQLDAAASPGATTASSAPTSPTCTSSATTTTSAAASSTSAATPGASPRDSARREVIRPERPLERRDHRVKDDRNRPAKPALVGPPRSSARRSAPPWRRRRDSSTRAASPSRGCGSTQISRAAGEVDRDPDHQRDTTACTATQHGIRHEAGLPLLHRRQPARRAHHDEQLPEDSADEQHREQPECKRKRRKIVHQQQWRGNAARTLTSARGFTPVPGGCTTVS